MILQPFDRLRSLIASTLVILGLLALNDAQAQMKASEPDLKAAIIINMAMFVDWPTQGPSPGNQLTICFITDSPVASALAKAQGKTIRNRTIDVRKVRLQALFGCHVAYLSSEERERLPQILAAVRGTPVLLTGDTPDLFPEGGMLNLELSDGHVVFDINLRNTQEAGLKISSKALRLARKVIE